MADVQGWLDDPAGNFGWIVLIDEGVPGSAKRFASREALLVHDRPRLLVEFTSAASPAGRIPDGGAGPGAPLVIEKLGDGDLRLTWGASCLAGDTSYEVYEGTLGVAGDWMARSCNTGGGTTAVVSPAAGSTVYVVVPRNAAVEGSYGTDSAGNERPAAVEACLPQSTASCP